MMAIPPKDTDNPDKDREKPELRKAMEKEDPPPVLNLGDPVAGEKNPNHHQDEQTKQQKLGEHGLISGTIGSANAEKEKDRKKISQADIEKNASVISAVAVASAQLMEDLQKLGEEIEELHNENIDVVEESSVVRSNLDVALQNMYYAASDLAYEGYFAQLDLEMMENSGYYSPEEIQAQKEIIEQCYTAVDAHDDLRETMLGYIHKMEKSEQALTEEDRILSGNFEALKEKIGNKEPTPEDKEALAKLHSEKINIETSRGQLAKFSKLTASFTEIITDVSRDKNLSLEQKTHGYETLNLVAKSSGDRHLDGKELAQIKENMLKVDPKSPYFARCCELLVKSGVTIEDGKGGKISGQEAVDHFIKSLGEAKVAANATPNGQVIQPGLKQGAVIPTTRGPDMAAATPTSYGCFADNEFNKTNPTTGPIPSYAVTTQNNAPDIGDVNEAHLAALAKTGTGTGDTGTDKETLAMEELLKQLERDQQNIPTSNPLA